MPFGYHQGGFPSGIIRYNWNDTEMISMALAQGWHAQIEKCKQGIFRTCKKVATMLFEALRFVFCRLFVVFEALRTHSSCSHLSSRSLTGRPSDTHRWNMNLRPGPQTFSKQVFTILCSWYCISLNWSSGALVGVGGSNFIDYIRQVAVDKSCHPSQATTNQREYFKCPLFRCPLIISFTTY